MFMKKCLEHLACLGIGAIGGLIVGAIINDNTNFHRPNRLIEPVSAAAGFVVTAGIAYKFRRDSQGYGGGSSSGPVPDDDEGYGRGR